MDKHNIYKDDKKVYIGIDRARIKNIEILSIARKKLISNHNVKYIETKEFEGAYINASLSHNGYYVREITIKDDPYFKAFRFGAKRNNYDGAFIIYCSLELIVDRKDGSKNLFPYTVSEFHARINLIRQHLIDRYGIIVSFKEAKFDELEINKTASMDNKFIAYDYLLSNIRYLASSKWTTVTHEKSTEINQIALVNGCMKIKCYDKTKQLQAIKKTKKKDDMITMESEEERLNRLAKEDRESQEEAYREQLIKKNWLRIEYCFLKQDKIIRDLNIVNIYQLTDEKINSYLNEQIEKELLTPIRVHLATGNKQLLKMAKEILKQSNRRWISTFTIKAIAEKVNKTNGKLDLLIDTQQLKDIIKKLTPDHASRNIKTLEKTLVNYPYLYNNIIHLEEITEKFTT